MQTIIIDNKPYDISILKDKIISFDKNHGDKIKELDSTVRFFNDNVFHFVGHLIEPDVYDLSIKLLYIKLFPDDELSKGIYKDLIKDFNKYYPKDSTYKGYPLNF